MFDENCPRISPDSFARKLVVFFHGYGANGANLLEIGEIWRPFLKDTAFYAPNGIEPSEINPFGGYQWFGLPDLEPFNVRPGLEKHQAKIVEALKGLLAFHKLIPSDLVIVGFSQGAMVALNSLFGLPGLGGVIGYSGAFYPPLSPPPVISPPPVLLVHGTLDTVVPFAMMGASASRLSESGVTVSTLALKNLAHSINDEAIEVGLNFIRHIRENQPIAL